MKRKRVVVLGATGSIGDSALKVARDIPERMEIVGLAANTKTRTHRNSRNRRTPSGRRRFVWSMNRGSMSCAKI
jgi:1-deoxy-D-xylulose 5-phosphate reductoisomerase